LQNLDHTMGFWINMTEADTLVLTGSAPETTNILLSTGWNLVGYPSIDTQVLPDALENNGIVDYSIIMTFHADDVADPWKIYDPAAPSYSNTLLEMAPSWGYWLDAGSDSVWNVIYDLP